MKEKTISVTLLLTLVLFAGMIQANIARAPVPSGWDFSLTATLDGFDDESTFGVETDATDCFDPDYDQFDPPAPPTGVHSYFWNPDCPTTPVDQRKLQTSIIPPSECVVTWTYKVKPVGGIAGEMCISWDANEFMVIPPEWNFFLDDVNMRDTETHCFTAESDVTYTFTIQVSAQYQLLIEVVGGGTTDPTPGTHTFDCCTDVTVDAIEADPCWQFDAWELDGVPKSSDPSVTVHMDDNHLLVAIFVEIPFDLTIEVSPSGDGDTSPPPGTYHYECYTDVTVDAIETDPSKPFDHWDLDGSFLSADPSVVVHMDGHHTLTAVFGLRQHDLAIAVVGTGTTDPSPGTYTIDFCTDVTVDAIEADPCWTFDQWLLDGVDVGSAPSVTIHIDDDHTLTAVFVQKTYALTIEVDGIGTTDPTPGTHLIDCCTDVWVEAIETDPCWRFHLWEVDGTVAPVGSSVFVHMDDDHTLTAIFEKIQYDLNIEVVGTGNTDPTPGTYAIDCCTMLTVNAIETDGPFDHWKIDGGFFSFDPSVTIHMGDHHTLTAVFVGWNVVLTAEKEGYTDVSDFGVRPDATNCFDAAYDEIDTPAPPAGVVSYFWHPCCPTTPVDQRKLATSKIAPAPLMTWTYKVKPVAIDGTMCISWSASDIASIPLELDVYLHCPDCAVINMRTETEYCFPAESDTTYTFTIGVGGCSVELHLSAGWNMVSFPCLPDDPSFDNIFCSLDFYQVLTWDGTKYVSPTTAEAGRGYWVLVLTDTTVTVANGNPVESYERKFCGWSMIGSIITCTVDADCVFPDYYRLYTWDGTQYVGTTVIEPGKGYWALVLTCTQIVVDDSCCTP